MTKTIPTGIKVNGNVYTLGLQPDGKILVGGGFTALGGQMRNFIGRLNADGTLDSGFDPGANSYVYSLGLQSDGKILVGGEFTALGAQTRYYIARLNADGTLDSGFNPGANNGVNSLVVQADGKILVGGEFTMLGDQWRSRIARLNPDGTLDLAFFSLKANDYVESLALQADGKILVGGWFTTLGGRLRSRIARLNNTVPAVQRLTYDGTTITWLRGGASPEVWRASFAFSTNGSDWLLLGQGSRIPGGWQLAGVSLPSDAKIRARGYVTGGRYSGSCWFVESVYPQLPPWIIKDDSSFGQFTNGFQFSYAGSAGSTVVVEGSTNLQDWSPLQTNMLVTGPLHFRDPRATNSPAGFYRARLAP